MNSRFCRNLRPVPQADATDDGARTSDAQRRVERLCGSDAFEHCIGAGTRELDNTLDGSVITRRLHRAQRRPVHAGVSGFCLRDHDISFMLPPVQWMQYSWKGGSLTMRVPYVFNIQHFSTHDGPGVRTTIFFKGCPLRCVWCHNPESQRFTPETMTNRDGRKTIVGKQYTIDELMEDVMKDIIVYEQSGGGVTLSGGEALAMDGAYIRELAQRLTENEISVGIDTCGVVTTERIKAIAQYADFFLYDLKLIDDDAHRKYTGGSNRLVLNNLITLNDLHARIFLRLIMVPGVNTNRYTIQRTMDWLRNHHITPEQINLLPYHRLGMDKYSQLGRRPVLFNIPDDTLMQDIKTQVESYYDTVTIGG
jgi:pyruvate formate lyase activating enzyme